jgi:succinate-semialdehyde dehydrogenase/glutarate-semialdehyde dehydrogenase
MKDSQSMPYQSLSDYPMLRFHIDGEWVDVGSRRIHRVLNPATGEQLAELPLADAADLDRALAAADRGFHLWRRSTPEERSGVLQRAAQLLRERIEIIAAIATREEGKTLAETRIETHVTANLFDFYGAEAKRIYGRVLVRPSGMRSMVLKEPVGPVVAFAPWEFPDQQSGPQARCPHCGRLLGDLETRRGSASVGDRSGACTARRGPTFRSGSISVRRPG